MLSQQSSKSCLVAIFCARSMSFAATTAGLKPIRPMPIGYLLCQRKSMGLAWAASSTLAAIFFTLTNLVAL